VSRSGSEGRLEREAASGDDGAVAALQNQTSPSFRRCAGERGGERYRREVVGSPWFTEFDGFPWQLLRTPAIKFAGLAANLQEEVEGKQRGGVGLL
jgi:hypothetical protein